MSDLLNQVRQICENRIAEVTITDREKQLIEHIKGLQRTIEVTKAYLPEDMKAYVNQHLEISNEVVNLTLGIRR